jgi:hypothetical protein
MAVWDISGIGAIFRAGGRVLAGGVVITLKTFAAKAARAEASRILRDAMIKEGLKAADGQAAHHIVAFGSSGMQQAREILIHWGIDINNAANGVFIEGAFNSTLHNNVDYIKAVTEGLAAAKSSEEALLILKGMRDDIMAGKFPGILPQ